MRLLCLSLHPLKTRRDIFQSCAGDSHMKDGWHQLAAIGFFNKCTKLARFIMPVWLSPYISLRVHARFYVTPCLQELLRCPVVNTVQRKIKKQNNNIYKKIFPPWRLNYQWHVGLNLALRAVETDVIGTSAKKERTVDVWQSRYKVCHLLPALVVALYTREYHIIISHYRL